MTEYEKYFKSFHVDKIAFLSGKKQYKTCDSCKNTKQFIEKDNQLIYSCGAKTGACGIQYIVHLPEYMTYQSRKKMLHEELHGSMKDYHSVIQDLSYMNQDILKKYLQTVTIEKIPTIRNIKDKPNFQKKLDSLEGLYKKTNNLHERYKTGISYHTLKMKTLNEQKKILSTLKEDISEEEKKDLRIKYADLSKELGKEYTHFQEIATKPIQMILLESKGSIQKENLEKLVSDESSESSDEDMEEIPYKIGDTITWKSKTGKITDIFSKKDKITFKMETSDGKKYRVKYDDIKD
jgi:hypothetical protein